MRANDLRRTLSLLAAVALLGAGAACDRTPTGGGHAAVAAVRVSVGAQAVTVTDAGVQTGTMTLAQGTHVVQVTWLDATGAAITIPAQGFALAIVPATGTTGVAFSATSLTGGTLTATSAGEKAMNVRLLHGTHADFSQRITFTVQ
jgi:hypothetical protein